MRCPACTLVYQRFAGDDRLLSELYGEWINDFNLPAEDPVYQAELSAPLRSRDGHEILVAADFLSTRPERMTVLDFGMGWALWGRIARRLGCSTFGQELTPDRVAYAKAHDISTVATNELGAGVFDFINSEQVMEHLRDLAAVGGKLAGSLRIGGILKVSVPNSAGAPRTVERLRSGRCGGTIDEIMPIQPLEHLNSFTERSLRIFADRHGLEIVRPSLMHRYAFLKHPGTISLLSPKKTVKELIRPIYQYHNKRNLYVWMRKLA